MADFFIHDGEIVQFRKAVGIARVGKQFYMVEIELYAQCTHGRYFEALVIEIIEIQIGFDGVEFDQQARLGDQFAIQRITECRADGHVALDEIVAQFALGQQGDFEVIGPDNRFGSNGDIDITDWNTQRFVPAKAFLYPVQLGLQGEIIAEIDFGDNTRRKNGRKFEIRCELIERFGDAGGRKVSAGFEPDGDLGSGDLLTEQGQYSGQKDLLRGFHILQVSDLN